MKPTVYMMLGLTGSGKSTFSAKLAKQLNLERFAFDLKYKNLGGDLSDHKWNDPVAQKTSRLMESWMAVRIKRGESVIVDYCPWLKDERLKFQELVEAMGATSHIFYFDVDHDELLKRLSRRNEEDKNSQYVSREMLEDFVQRFEAPDGEAVEIIKT